MEVKQDLIVVAIGASAGGIEAVKALLPGLPHKGICYIFCLHLSPNHPSKLKEVLTRETKLLIKEIDKKTPLQEGHLYIPVPGKNIEVTDNSLNISNPKGKKRPSPSIDHLFESLASSLNTNAVALLMSGSGNDGALGVVEIKNNGGLILVQDPESTQYASMPRAAIDTQLVDLVDKPDNISRCLQRLGDKKQPPLEIFEQEESVFKRIIKLINTKTRVDFSDYRTPSIRRRLTRRMAMLNIDNLKEYEKKIISDKQEALKFSQEAFVVVSEFYRDVDAFNALTKELANKVNENTLTDEFRIWVPACATGEEAYTLAMILEDIGAKNTIMSRYKILATDLSQQALATARNAEYEADKLTKLPKTWLCKYFNKVDDHFQVKPFIRERVVFSIHDVLLDPPFSRMDLVSCRNLIIYFNQSAQKKFFMTAAFSLKESGLLFLGNAEVCENYKFFSPAIEKHKIYARNNVENKRLISPQARSLVSDVPGKKHGTDTTQQDLYKALNEHYLPPLIIVDSENDIIFRGGNFNLLLESGSGFVDTNLYSQLHKKYRPEVRALLFRARQSGRLIEGSVYQQEDTGVNQHHRLCIQSMGKNFPGWQSIFFKENPPLAPSADNDKGSDTLLKQMDEELLETRENLQIVIEELESTNEQLQVNNEELQSSNEEYQSTNEELQTVNEELQSTNEELVTINEEYSNQSALYQRTFNDLQNIQNSITLPLVVLNKEYRIQRFNPECSQIIDTNKVNINDLVFALEWQWEINTLKPLLESVNANGKPISKELAVNGRHYECKISSTLNNHQESDGFILIFYETSGFKLAQRNLHEQKVVAQKTLETIMEGVIRVDSDLCIEFANPASARLSGWDAEKMPGRPVSQILQLIDNQAEFLIEDILKNSIKANKQWSNSETRLQLKTRQGKYLWVELTFSPMPAKEGSDLSGVIAFRDTTQHHKQLNELMWNSTHDSLTGLINRKEMEQRLEKSIRTAKQHNLISSLLYMDLDQFKVVNDTCGHIAGDHLLKQLSNMMMSMLRSRDTLARIGGDEFALLLEKCPLTEAEIIARKLQKAVSNHRFLWEDKIFRVGVSIGIVEVNADANQVSELLSQADTVCYLSKESGQDNIQIHRANNDELEVKRSQLNSVTIINEAIERNDFLLYFQKIGSLDQCTDTHWEVLIRMYNTEYGFLLPGAFLPAAERFGLATRIDLSVLHDTLTRVSKATAANKSHFPKLNINISGDTIGSEEFLEQLRNLIDQYHINPECLCFELTETATSSHYTKAKDFISAIRNLGCRFALDDFGQGMSSLSYLSSLPLDLVKIDGSFIQGIEKDAVKTAIVKSVKDVANLLNLQVVAEGIETQEQLTALEAVNIDYGQGFFMHKPVPFEEFISEVFLTEKTSADARGA